MRAAAWPEFLASTSFRSAGRPSNLARFIARMKVVL